MIHKMEINDLFIKKVSEIKRSLINENKKLLNLGDKRKYINNANKLDGIARILKIYDLCYNNYFEDI